MTHLEHSNVRLVSLFSWKALAPAALGLGLALGLACLPTRTAWADGGSGGESFAGTVGGSGGTDVVGNPGSAGSTDTTCCGSGGGGGGAGGGSGGDGGDSFPDGDNGVGALGGAGGTSTSSDGQAGSDAGAGGIVSWAGGGGGGGGYNGNGSGADDFSNSGTLQGGAGGAGGAGGYYDDNGDYGGGGGGGGGSGGAGAVALDTVTDPAAQNTGSISGGNGGAGGAAEEAGGGSGGDGGIGLWMDGEGGALSNSGSISGGDGGAGGTGDGAPIPDYSYSLSGSGGNGGIGVGFVDGGGLDNSGSISGGDGGAAGEATAGSGSGAAGAGGAGVSGADLAVTDSGSISGGYADAGNGLQADAIDFTGGTDSLTLEGEGAEDLSGNIGLDNFSALTLGDGNSTDSLGSAITGNGSLIFNGPNTLTLTAQNTYTGGTVVQAGTLALSGVGTLGAEDGTLTVNGGVLNLNGTSQGVGALSGSGGLIEIPGGSLLINEEGADTTYSGVISGNGTLWVDSLEPGTLVLDGQNTFTGGTFVESGTLEIGDTAGSQAVLPGLVTVESGGVLSGYGTAGGGAGGGVLNAGLVEPGDGGGPATLNVGGDYTQDPGGTLRLLVSPTQASQLNVAGTADLGGALDLVYEPGLYSRRAYTLLSADQVDGTFDQVETDGILSAAAVDAALSYTPQDVDLDLDAVAPQDATIYTALAGEALGLEQGSSRTLLSRLDAVSGQAGLGWTGGPPRGALGGWVRVLGEQDQVAGSGGVSGYTASMGGFQAGLDHRFGRDVVAGVEAHDEGVNVTQGDGESGTISSPGASLYGGMAWSLLRFEATAGVDWDSFSATRPVPGMDGNIGSWHQGVGAQGAGQVGLPLELAGVEVQPKLGLEYAYLGQPGFAETGMPGFDLTVDADTEQSLKPYVGLGATKAWALGRWRLGPELELGFSRELLETQAQDQVSVGGGTFTEQGVLPSLSQVTAGGGLAAVYGRDLALEADDTVVAGTNLLDQEVVTGAVRWGF